MSKCVKALWYFFKDSPARRTSFLAVVGDSLFPLKFCQCRWIENSPVAERALALWPNITKYINAHEEGTISTVGGSFLQEKQQKLKRLANKWFEVLESAVKDPLFVTKLHFYKCISDEIKPFLCRYQTNVPMMPFMEEDLVNLLQTLLNRFIRKDHVQKNPKRSMTGPTFQSLMRSVQRRKTSRTKSISVTNS
jgi:hypothetical protein